MLRPASRHGSGWLCSLSRGTLFVVTTRLFWAFGLAALLVVVGPGIGVAARPGDTSAGWLNGLLLVGASIRVAPALFARAGRQMSLGNEVAERSEAFDPVVVSIRTVHCRELFLAGVMSAGYSERQDHAEAPAWSSSSPNTDVGPLVFF